MRSKRLFEPASVPPVRSKRLFESAVQDHSPKKLDSATLCSAPLCSALLAPCMYMHGSTLVYIYIYMTSCSGPRALSTVQRRVCNNMGCHDHMSTRALGGRLPIDGWGAHLSILRERSVDPYIYMHGARRAESMQRGADRAQCSRVQLFQNVVSNSSLEQPSRAHRRHRGRLEQTLRAHWGHRAGLSSLFERRLEPFLTSLRFLEPF